MARFLIALIAGLSAAVACGQLMAATDSESNKTASGSSEKLPIALVPEDLARGKPATASSSQGDEHAASMANDGDDQTRWCASSEAMPQWWQVDLGKPQDVTGVRINWEMGDAAYKYRIEGSHDQQHWMTLADVPGFDHREQLQTHKFKTQKLRYVRLTVLGAEEGKWASMFGFEVLGTKMVPATASQTATNSDRRLLGQVKAPKGYEVTIFAAPPKVGYPACLTAAPSGGQVFIGIDETGSLGHQANAGRVVRATDTTGSGKADKFVTFATMDHPRGLIWDDGKLWVLHPPYLTLYTDDGTGVAGPGKELLTGISTDMVKERGADHTTNGIRMGIDGWIYIAMGDFGALHAVTSDGKPFQMHGGGIMRVRPDGTDLEVYCWGTRNIYDVAISPLMNVFTRDNTNDGDNWNDRLAYDVPSGYYGYPSYFMHFPGEFIDCLADYGGGAPCGSIFIDEPGLANGLYTVEWGNSEIDTHPLKPDGANFKAGFEKFMTLPRGTDIDVDGSAHIYVSSWDNGGFSYSGPDVGFVARVTPTTFKPVPFPDLHKASDDQLLEYLSSPSGVLRQAAQREILRRGPKAALDQGLGRIASSEGLIQGRVAAIFTLQQLRHENAYAALAKLAAIEPVREFALRALADKKGDSNIPISPFITALRDPNPRVRLMAAWGLARIGRQEAINPLMPLLADSDPLVAHVAMQSLVTLHAVDACLKAIDPSTANLATGAVRVLQHLHEVPVVEGLTARLNALQDPALRQIIYGGLCRLYHREADWDGSWWGTRPDTTGPYYKPVEWDGTSRINSVLTIALSKEPASTIRPLVSELERNGVQSQDIAAGVATAAARDPAVRDVVISALGNRRSLDNAQIKLLGDVASSDHEAVATRVKALRALQQAAGNDRALAAAIDALCAVLSTPQPDAQLRAALDEFIHDTAHASQVKSFRRLAQSGSPARSELSYAVLLNLSSSNLVKRPQKAAAQQAIEKAWDQPQATVSLLRAIALTHASQYAQKVNELKSDSRAPVKEAAIAAAAELGNSRLAGNVGALIQNMKYEQVVAEAGKDKGDVKWGAQLFVRQGCIACHTTSPDQPPKGPLLAGIAQRYNRAELCESILKPSAKIAQGFETQWFKLKQGDPVEGFVVRESGDSLEVRNVAGISTTLNKTDIVKRGKRDTSVMPEGLVAQLAPHDLASILAYLESLNSK